MITVAVTGGIGSGKSTVGRLLAERGAVTIDADQLARAALEPETAGFDAAVARFGSAILDERGVIDRSALGRIVFADDGALRDLEAIVHPVVQEEMARRLHALSSTDEVVVLELPLLVDSASHEPCRIDGILVVDVPIDLAIERVVRDRHLSEVDARARVVAQPDAARRLQAADFIIMNHGTTDELALMVDGAWSWIQRLRDERRGR